MWKKSLKVRLTLYVILPVMLALAASGSVAFYSAYRQSQEIYDAELSHVATLMLSLLKAEDEEEAKHGHPDDDDEGVNPDIIELGNDFDNTDQRNERKLAFRIWRHDKLLFYSRDASNFGDERVTAGFTNQEIAEKNWRFYVLPDASGYTLEVAQESRIRGTLITRILTTIFSPLALLVPIVLIVVWLGVRTGIRPLLAVSEAIGRRSSLDLAPLPTCQTLTEIRPLIGAINSLLANLDYALRKERRFTDFAAHELRTPIAIFKTQAQTALKASDDAERRMILEAQVQAADRATNMVDQLLTLARLEHTDIPTEMLAVSNIAQNIVEERMPLAKAKQITLRFNGQAHPFVLGNKDLLAIILTNLVDNAIKYTPSRGAITVTVSRDNAVAISVRDTGPGIPEDEISLVTERFYRSTRHKQPGAGLGLTIVKRAAEIMGAVFILRNNLAGEGLEAILRFSASPE